MLNYYFTYYTTKLNGEAISTKCGSCICSEEEAKDEVISINWDNLKDFYHEYGLVCGFNVWNMKKGRRISLFGKAFSDRKEWKHPETGLTFEITHRMYEPSIQTILDWHDQRKAIQYLNERNCGLGMTNKSKKKEVIAMSKEEIRQLVLEMMEECPMFRGEYDAKNGNEDFMYGISTVMEYLACRVDDEFYQYVSDTFIHNMVKSEEKYKCVK